MGIQSFIKRVAVQTAVYWGNPQANGQGGIDYDEPVEIKCRWDDVVKVVTDAKGKEITTMAEVLVTQHLDVDGRLFLGTLDDLDSGQLDDPASIDRCFAIKRFDKSPEFRSTTKFVRVAYL